MTIDGLVMCDNCEGSGSAEDAFGDVWTCEECGGSGWREPIDEDEL